MILFRLHIYFKFYDIAIYAFLVYTASLYQILHCILRFIIILAAISSINTINNSYFPCMEHSECK